MLVTLVRMAFLGLLTVLGSVYSTYAAAMTRQPSILNSSTIQRLEAGSSHNTFDLPVNGTRPINSPLISSALLASNRSADPHEPSSEYQLLPDANTVPCWHKSLGENLKKLSCLSASLRIEVNNQVQKAIQNGLEYRAASYLPFRWLSCEYSPTDGIISRGRSLKSSSRGHVADGTCAIDVVFARN